MKLVLERFPDVRAAAAQLFERDEAFRELCEEYEACDRAAERLKDAYPAEAAIRREYAALKLRLEAELLRYLHEHPQKGED